VTGASGWKQLTTGDGRPLPAHLKAQIGRELDRLELLLKQLKAVEAERDALLEPTSDDGPTPATLLAKLKGVGPEFAAVLWSEGLFRSFGNRRQVAAYAGLAPTPWQSGSVQHEQGVSKSGNPRLRTTMIQLAWLWLRHQPTSELSLWFQERMRHNDGRGKRTAIVALARKAPRRALEVLVQRRRHRGRGDEGRLNGQAIASSIRQDLDRVLTDPGGRTDRQHGFESRCSRMVSPS
jgi:transposase